jgi:hypothetical protein
MVWSSTTGKYHGAGKQVSEALGAKLNANLAEGGHPFDLEFGKLLPGKAGCAFHTHSAQCFSSSPDPRWRADATLAAAASARATAAVCRRWRRWTW